ncbi:MAG: tRNA (N(6)-L-threonylcarbamoyladenosine(37)-C(2))-methylthiotransferase MtaB [Planctomycetes bacterium]|nr:tRNA (N(6)-L-threonylcarbamoyladenosine(37)-C(2))-methylthiotransferase MtaB [Planctomycetota bacterium]
MRPDSKKFFLITLGCKVNQYEAELMRETLLVRGYSETSVPEDAALCIANTCTVTNSADSKSLKAIRHFRQVNRTAKVVITGCSTAIGADALRKLVPDSTILPNVDKSDILSVVDGAGQGERLKGISKFIGHTRAFLKIQDGCDLYCTYCIIPVIRGKPLSKPLEDIWVEASALANSGYKEIILTGIHLGSYGRDLLPAVSLMDAVRRMLTIKEIRRIRLSSMEVNEISDDDVRFIAENPRVCPHFHFPLQSGDDGILKRMNRRYDIAFFLKRLDGIRKAITLPGFTTDVIVGFPGETEKQFQNTMETCAKAGFSKIHVFPYSSRRNTPASRFPGRCQQAELKGRLSRLKDLEKKLAVEYKNNFLNKEACVLVEKGRDKKTGSLCGFTERYVKALFEGGDNLKNTFANVRIDAVKADYCTGVITSSG